MNNCKFLNLSQKICGESTVRNGDFCKTHHFYTGKVDPNNLKRCEKHPNIYDLLIWDENKKYYCRLCKKLEEKESNTNYCKGIDKKGNKCPYKSLLNDNYCQLHQSYKKWKNLSDTGFKVCNDWIRGCWNIINNDFVKCESCRIKEREKDKKLRQSKNDFITEYNSKNINKKMCKDCGTIVKELIINICKNCDMKRNIKKNNPDKKKRIRDIFLKKLYEYHQGAKLRNLDWEISDEIALSMFKEKCYYCDSFNNINGIDRKDSNKGYIIDNCVPCCTQCNFMKLDKTIDDFYKMCEHISTNNNLYSGKLYPEVFKRSNNCKYNLYKFNSNKRNIDFKITEKTFNSLTSQKCTYCGCFEDGCGGIDRVNSDECYVKDNCVPCCYSCNIAKLTYSRFSFLEKCVSITFKKNGLIYKPEVSETEESKLIEMFKEMEFIENTDNSIFNYKNNPEYYESLIWNGSLSDLKKVEIELVFVNNEILRDLWDYYRNTTSSLPRQQNSKLVGRQIYILVKDKISNKYLGIMSLNSDILNYEAREKYIGWTNQEKVLNNKINYLMNLSTCVPLQPFGFNFNGGKLLAMLAFSQEVIDHFEQKYGNELLGITTTSLYGKSIQYDRLKELKFLGFTKGNSTYKIPEILIDRCRKYLLSKGITYSRKLFIVGKTLLDLGLSRELYMSDTPKGIYFGFCHPQAKDYLTGKVDKINKFKNNNAKIIFTTWFDRWAKQRYNHLFANNLLKNITIKNQSLKNKGKNTEYFKKYYQDKKAEKLKDVKIPDNKIVFPKNFSLYKEKEKYILQFLRSTDGKKEHCKITVSSNDINKEMAKLVTKIKDKYPEIIIENTNIINSHLFVFEEKEKQEIQEKNNVPKPELPINFSIFTTNGIDFLQYLKKIDGNVYQLQRSIKSNDIQKEFDNFVDIINNKFTLQIPKTIINNPQNWKTSNKIIDHEETDEKLKNREKAKKSLDKKRIEMGDEAYKAMKAQQQKESRDKKKVKQMEL